MYSCKTTAIVGLAAKNVIALTTTNVQLPLRLLMEPNYSCPRDYGLGGVAAAGLSAEAIAECHGRHHHQKGLLGQRDTKF